MVAGEGVGTVVVMMDPPVVALTMLMVEDPGGAAVEVVSEGHDVEVLVRFSIGSVDVNAVLDVAPVVQVGVVVAELELPLLLFAEPLATPLTPISTTAVNAQGYYTINNHPFAVAFIISVNCNFIIK